MHCPQCGTSATAGQQFCRSCGLNLEKIEELLGEQFLAKRSLPADDPAKLRERQHKLERWAGIAGLSTFGLILVTLIVIITREMFVKGGKILPGLFLILIAIGAALMGGFMTYSKSLKEKLLSRPLPPPTRSESDETPKLESYREPVPSVAERTTELLAARQAPETERLDN